VEVAQGFDVGMAEYRIVVETDLGIETDEPTLLGHHQRIDLDQARVLIEKQPIERAHKLRTLLRLIAFELQRRGYHAGGERPQARGRIDGERGDLLWRLGRHLLDIDAAFGRGDERQASAVTVDEQ